MRTKITEYVQPSGTVDREARLVRGVKILGMQSANGREYTAEAIRKAAGLYEGRPIYTDHPVKPGQARSVYDRFGTIARTEVRADGLYGDVRYMPKHQLAESFLDAVEHEHGAYGFSHVAYAKETRRGDKVLVEEISEVESVDLVAEPATVKGLFEGRRMPTIRELKATTSGAIARLYEQMDAAGMGDVAAEAPAPESSPEEQLLAGFEAAVIAVFRDTSMDFAAKKSKIGELLKMAEKATMKAEEPAPSEESGEESAPAESKQKGTEMKALQEELAALKRREKARELCAEAGVTPTKALLNVLSTANEADAKEVLESYRAGAEKRSTARSGGQVKEHQNGVPKNAKEFAAAITE